VPDGKAAAFSIVDRLDGGARDERAEVVAALQASPAWISPKYFYDELGCALYGAITKLPEYYPTRTEIALFERSRAEIAAAMGQGRQFVDLGSGDSRKAQEWLPHAGAARYVAVDIAADEMRAALTRMSTEVAGVDLAGVVTDFTRGLPLEDVLDARPARSFLSQAI